MLPARLRSRPVFTSASRPCPAALDNLLHSHPVDPMTHPEGSGCVRSSGSRPSPLSRSLRGCHSAVGGACFCPGQGSPARTPSRGRLQPRWPSGTATAPLPPPLQAGKGRGSHHHGGAGPAGGTTRHQLPAQHLLEQGRPPQGARISSSSRRRWAMPAWVRVALAPAGRPPSPARACAHQPRARLT